ncbi:hypothetical protein [Actinomadura sp. 6N118]|uniref:hypothetical protein n=1 Tax=Actinomadura sp. 6N118 TaxID=3375151 RepID=UPI0037A78C28
MVAGFHSFFWNNSDLDEELNQALDELMEPTEEGAYLRAFRTMLHSGDTAAAGIALDHFQYSGALTRFGGESVVEQYETEVLAVARDLLRQPPMPDGSNHASALNAMMNIAEPADADLIADALETTNGNVHDPACAAAGTALARSDVPSPRLLAVLAALAFDEAIDMEDRTRALSSVAEADCPEAIRLLIRATESPALEMQVAGAVGLGIHDRLPVHRELLERLVATWPEEAGYQAMVLRDQLTGFHSTHWRGQELDDPELRLAHQELMFPSGEETYRRAFRALLAGDHPMAVGVALDHLESYEGLRKVLDDVDEYLPEALTRARDLLRQSTLVSAHLSALDLIGTAHGEASDAELITDLLAGTPSEDVRHKALWVADGILRSHPDTELIDVVSRLASDQHHSGTALRVLGETPGPEANAAIVEALHNDDFSVQLNAAWELSHADRIDDHRELLAQVIESWPADMTGRSGFLAKQIRQRLQEPRPVN